MADYFNKIQLAYQNGSTWNWNYRSDTNDPNPISDITTALGLGYDSTNNVMYIGSTYDNVGFQLVTTNATSNMMLYPFVNGARYTTTYMSVNANQNSYLYYKIFSDKICIGMSSDGIPRIQLIISKGTKIADNSKIDVYYFKKGNNTSSGVDSYCHLWTKDTDLSTKIIQPYGNSGSLCLLTPDDTIGMLKVMKTDEGIICDDLYAAPYFPSNKYQASTCVIKINGIEYILPEKHIGSSTSGNGTLPFLLNTGVQATE